MIWKTSMLRELATMMLQARGGGGNKDTPCMSSICGSRLAAGEKNV